MHTDFTVVEYCSSTAQRERGKILLFIYLWGWGGDVHLTTGLRGTILGSLSTVWEAVGNSWDISNAVLGHKHDQSHPQRVVSSE